mgnify:CR=1 FL=1
MKLELITQEPGLVTRRLVLEPGEAMPWHVDPCRRFSVVVRGEHLTIEYRRDGRTIPIVVVPGMAEWDDPEPEEHRGVNTGSVPYEEVVIFFLPHPGADPQPGRK